jgi:hypothetical protein
VEDSVGSVIPKAQIFLSGSAGNYSTSADNRGAYSFKDIPAGYYDLSASAAGFQDYRARILVPSYGQVSRRLTLQIGNLGGCPVIDASPAPLIPLRGVVVDSSGGRVPYAIVSLYTRGSQRPVRMMTAPDASFQFQDVAPPALITAEYGKQSGELAVSQYGWTDLKIVLGVGR